MGVRPRTRVLPPRHELERELRLEHEMDDVTLTKQWRTGPSPLCTPPPLRKGLGPPCQKKAHRLAKEPAMAPDQRRPAGRSVLSV